MLRGAHGAPRGARLLPMPGVTRVTYENNSHDENFPLNQLPEKIDPLHSRWRTPTLRVLEGLGEDATDWPDLRYPLCQRAAGGSGDPSLCLPSLTGTEPCPTGQRAARAARSAENRGGPDWTRHAGVPVGCAGASPGPDGGALGGGVGHGGCTAVASGALGLVPATVWASTGSAKAAGTLRPGGGVCGGGVRVTSRST